ncbi:hypothetical protein, partial [Candidatus Halocynthiibacter alkanivorans]|uniref:hypothetical protein n=1 Tax=Candidatus Halocynthiibacter alkanivorans TaxID=2267619 RepID=UPI001F189E8F
PAPLYDRLIARPCQTAGAGNCGSTANSHGPFDPLRRNNLWRDGSRNFSCHLMPAFLVHVFRTTGKK